jgi:hypothetical protein
LLAAATDHAHAAMRPAFSRGFRWRWAASSAAALLQLIPCR